MSVMILLLLSCDASSSPSPDHRTSPLGATCAALQERCGAALVLQQQIRRLAQLRRHPALPYSADGMYVQVTLGHVVDRKMREMGYIRKPAVDELKNRRSLRDRVAAEGAPEVRTAEGA